MFRSLFLRRCSLASSLESSLLRHFFRFHVTFAFFSRWSFVHSGIVRCWALERQERKGQGKGEEVKIASFLCWIYFRVECDAICSYHLAQYALFSLANGTHVLFDSENWQFDLKYAHRRMAEFNSCVTTPMTRDQRTPSLIAAINYSIAIKVTAKYFRNEMFLIWCDIISGGCQLNRGHRIEQLRSLFFCCGFVLFYASNRMGSIG